MMFLSGLGNMSNEIDTGPKRHDRSDPAFSDTCLRQSFAQLINFPPNIFPTIMRSTLARLVPGC